MRQFFITLITFVVVAAGSSAIAHPGSGIVVDRQGNVYFVDTGSGVWKIDRGGKLSRLSAPAFHWMAIDAGQRLTGVPLPEFPRGGATVARDAGDPRILVSSDFPLSVGADGSLYYPWLHPGEPLRIYRLAPTGRTTVATTLRERTDGTPLRWLNGIAASADGSIYFSEDAAVRRITPRGEITTVVRDLGLTGCDGVPGVEPETGPYFRGLDVDTGGTVYVAATGCRAVLKITQDGNVRTILQNSDAWSPTSVAVSGSDVYVLEYLHTEGDNRREWLPRVRKVSADGGVVTLAALHR